MVIVKYSLELKFNFTDGKRIFLQNKLVISEERNGFISLSLRATSQGGLIGITNYETNRHKLQLTLQTNAISCDRM